MIDLGHDRKGEESSDQPFEGENAETLTIDIREMQLADLDGVLWVEQSSFRTPWTRTMFEDEFKNPDMAHYLIAQGHDHVVGYMGFWLIQKEAHITNLAVHPAFRRQKIGERLLFAAMRLAHRLGAERATLEVRASNDSAQKLYAKYGFQLVAIRKKYYNDNNEDAWIMWMNDLKTFFTGLP
jgi:ribosomal-protein-alanine N-acetyltransferase